MDNKQCSEDKPKKRKLSTARNTLRHAEKPRESTCLFADIVAYTAIQAYKTSVPKNLQKRYAEGQTVFSAFLLHDKSKASAMKVSKSDVHHNFVKLLSNPSFPLKVVAFGVGTKYMKKCDIDLDLETGVCVHDCHAEVLAKRAFVRYLIKEMQKHHKQHSSVSCLEKLETLRFRLKPCFRLILYTSSAPCGNAVLKRWAKGQKERYNSSWDKNPFDYPSEMHDKILLQSLYQGQIAPLVKREDDTSVQLPDEPEARCDKYGRIAPGTAQVGMGLGSIYSCSDKIAFWNILGVQSGILMNLLEDPVYIAAIVIGRKFSRPHLRRALCCRLQDFKASRFPDIGKEGNNYRLNHPALLCTSVKFDHGVLTQTTKASFNCNECFCWTAEESIDILDGRAGKSTLFKESTVCRKALVSEVMKLPGFTCCSYSGLKEKGRARLYCRIKRSFRRLKMYKYLNDQKSVVFNRN